MRLSVVLIWDEEGQVWVAEVPALDGVATSGETVAEALAMARDMIALIVADRRAHGEHLPDGEVDIQLHTVDVDEADVECVITVPHAAHQADS